MESGSKLFGKITKLKKLKSVDETLDKLNLDVESGEIDHWYVIPFEEAGQFEHDTCNANLLDGSTRLRQFHTHL